MRYVYVVFALVYEQTYNCFLYCFCFLFSEFSLLLLLLYRFHCYCCCFVVWPPLFNGENWNSQFSLVFFIVKFPFSFRQSSRVYKFV